MNLNIRFICLAIFLAIPWVNPFSPGPSNDVVSLILSVGCVGLLLLIFPYRGGLSQLGKIFFVIFCVLFIIHWSFTGGRYGSEFIGLLAAAIIFYVAVLCGFGIVEYSANFKKVNENFQRGVNNPLDWLAYSWLLIALLSSFIGILQYFGFADYFKPWVNQTPRIGEAFANLRQRNLFATLTGIGLISLLGIIRFKRITCFKSRLMIGVFVYGSVLILALGNAVSGSRTGLFEWILVLILAIWWDFSSKQGMGVIALKAVLIYFLSVISLPWILYLLTGVKVDLAFNRLIEFPGCESRKFLWLNVFELIEKKPWVGWGWGELDYAQFFTLFQSQRFCGAFDNAHNLPLHLAVEFGIPTAIIICGFFCWLVWRAKPWLDTNPVKQTIWGVLALIAFHSLLEFPLWYGSFQITMGICVGVLWKYSVKKPESEDGFSRYGVKNSIFSYCLSGVCLLLMVLSGFDYYGVRQVYLPLSERAHNYKINTVDRIQSTWIFSDQAKFALLMSVKVVDENNAHAIYRLAHDMLHYSPEPRVIERLIEIASILNLDDDVNFYKLRYMAAYPEAYEKWLAIRNKYNH